MNLISLLHKIQSEISAENPASSDTIILPKDTKIYNIDLDTREIEAPEVLSVQSDHYAETFYFLVDRYYDNMDLAQTNCIIQYVIGDQSYVYAVPYCDVTTFEGKILIPWIISASATQSGGTVKYFVRFYLTKGSLTEDPETKESQAHFIYSLSTLPAKSTILKTLPQDSFIQEDDILKLKFNEKEMDLSPQNEFQETLVTLGLPERYLEIVDVFTHMVDNSTIYWNEV